MRSLLVILPFLLSTTLFAQQWNWAADAGGGGNTDFCYDIATDSQGNAYWVGTVSGTAAFGCETLSPGSTIAGVVAKYAPDGTCQWVQGITTTFYDAWVYGIVIDEGDRIYITGSCQGTTDFGNGVILSGTGSSDDWFTARYTVDGDCVWARRIANSNGSSEGRGLALDDDGALYVTGFAGGSGYTFGDVVVNNGSFTRQAVLVKYDSTGTAIWGRSTSGTTGGRTNARGIAVAGDRLFITGQVYFATTSYHGLQITSTNTTSHAFVLACDLQGEPLWARAYGGGDNEGFAIAADSLGNVFMSGRFWGNLYLEDDTLTSASNDDDALFMGFTSEGSLRWAEQVGSDERDIGWSAVCDGQGNAYFSAHFNNTVDVLGTGMTALGEEDALIMKVDADGELVWASRPSGFQRDIPLCIHRQAVAPHQLYFGGYFWGAITYGSSTIDDVLNGDAMIVAGIDTTFDASVAAVASCPMSCEGAAYAFANGEEPFTYAWSNGATTSSITGLCAGEYIVDVTDGNGYMTTDTVLVTDAVDPDIIVQQQGDSLWVEGGAEWIWLLEGLEVSAGQPYHIAEQNGSYAVQYTDAEDCPWTTDPVTIVLNVGMDEEDQDGVKLYPNPAVGIVRIEGEGNSTIRRAIAIDVLGRRVDLPVTGQYSLDVHHLATGTWIIQFETVSGTEHARLVKE